LTLCWSPLDLTDLEHGDLCARAVLMSLPEAARSYLEECMATERRFYLDFLQESYEKGQANGEVRGEAKAVLEVLLARGVDVPDAVRAPRRPDRVPPGAARLT
jgi:hypothetical protein